MQFFADFMQPEAANELLAWALRQPWQQEQFKLYGRTLDVPRTTAWHGDPGINYRYTNLDHACNGWPAELQALRNQICTLTGNSFNFVLLNRYDHGAHHMGWHRDDEPQAAPMLASLSLGATRRFRYREAPGQTSHGIDLTHGSLLCFDGRVQHMLCRTRRPVATRVNLTFRQIRT